MTNENKEILLKLLERHTALGISQQIDYEKFYLYSIITHSTAIEGSTVTEIEAQLLFDEGITSSQRTMAEQLMNLDLKAAYEYGMQWIKAHEDITVDWLITLSSKVMAHTGSEYHAMGGGFSAAKGELRKLNVTAGLGGPSYLSYQKVPSCLAAFCDELNKRRKEVNPSDIAAIYDLSFWAHYELVTIHPWADGNGRTSRLLMNLLQWEYNVLPTKVLKGDKAVYIKALTDTREQKKLDIFLNCMARLHIQHLTNDINLYINSVGDDLPSMQMGNDKNNRKKVIEFDQKSNRAEQKSNRVRLTAKQKKVLEFCNKTPHTAQEILEMIGVKYQTRTVHQYITKLFIAEVLRPTTANKNAPNRKYITAHGKD